MKPLLTTFGIQGDLEPFVGLGLELKKRGHFPVIATSPQFENRVRSLGLEFQPLGGKALVEGLSEAIEAEIGGNFHEFRNQKKRVVPELELRQIAEQLIEQCQGCDMLIGLSQFTLAEIAHKKTGIPYIAVQLDAFNDAYFQASRHQIAVIEKLFGMLLNPVRQAYGLPPSEHPFTTDGYSELATLFVTTKLIYDPKQQKDWPAHYHVTGFFFMEEKGQWTPPESLSRFLEQGEPPVLITFGSMKHPDPDSLTQLVIEATQLSGCRAILQKGWSGLGLNHQLPEQIYLADFIPYEWLLPKVACVVQTAGHGTTAYTLKAGVPSVCIPHTWYQYSYAQFARACGFAGPIVPFERLTASGLARAMAETVAIPMYRNRAVEVSKVIMQEGGAPFAADIVEQAAKKLGLIH